MATELAKAFVQIMPSAEGISENLSSVMNSEGASSGETFGNSMSSRIKKVLAGAGIAAAVTSGFKALKNGISDLAEYGDNIDKMSQKMGLSAEAYQEWDAVMQHSGTSIESLQASMKTMSAAAESGNAAFERLGITEEQIANMSKEDLFASVISGLQGMEEGTERTYLAGQLLGRGTTELGALLNTSAEETEAMKQRVHELGGVMSDEAVKDAAAFQDSLQDFQTAASGITRGLLSDFLPSVTGIMDGLTEIFSGNTEEGVAIISENVSAMCDNIAAAIPQMLEIGLGIVQGLVSAIAANLPEILKTGVEVVSTLAMGLLDNLPAVLDAAFDLIEGLIDGIIEHLPEVIEMGIELVAKLVVGLIEAIPKIIEALPRIFSAIKDGFKNVDWAELGKAIINGIVAGIKAIGASIGNAVKDVAQGALNAAKNFLGIHSPSRVFRDEVGKMLGEGFAEGIEDSTKVVTGAMDELSAATVDDIDLGVAVSPNYSAQTASGIDSDAIVRAITAGVASIVASVNGIEAPSVVIGDRDIFQAYNRGATLAGTSLVGV